MLLILLSCCCLFKEMTEDLASINSLCGTTTGKNSFKEVEKTLIQYESVKCVITVVNMYEQNKNA